MPQNFGDEALHGGKEGQGFVIKRESRDFVSAHDYAVAERERRLYNTGVLFHDDALKASQDALHAGSLRVRPASESAAIRSDGPFMSNTWSDEEAVHILLATLLHEQDLQRARAEEVMERTRDAFELGSATQEDSLFALEQNARQVLASEEMADRNILQISVFKALMAYLEYTGEPLQRRQGRVERQEEWERALLLWQHRSESRWLFSAVTAAGSQPLLYLLQEQEMVCRDVLERMQRHVWRLFAVQSEELHTREVWIREEEMRRETLKIQQVHWSMLMQSRHPQTTPFVDTSKLSAFMALQLDRRETQGRLRVSVEEEEARLELRRRLNESWEVAHFYEALHSQRRSQNVAVIADSPQFYVKPVQPQVKPASTTSLLNPLLTFAAESEHAWRQSIRAEEAVQRQELWIQLRFVIHSLIPHPPQQLRSEQADRHRFRELSTEPPGGLDPPTPVHVLSPPSIKPPSPLARRETEEERAATRRKNIFERALLEETEEIERKALEALLPALLDSDELWRSAEAEHRAFVAAFEAEARDKLFTRGFESYGPVVTVATVPWRALTPSQEQRAIYFEAYLNNAAVKIQSEWRRFLARRAVAIMREQAESREKAQFSLLAKVHDELEQHARRATTPEARNHVRTMYALLPPHVRKQIVLREEGFSGDGRYEIEYDGSYYDVGDTRVVQYADQKAVAAPVHAPPLLAQPLFPAIGPRAYPPPQLHSSYAYPMRPPAPSVSTPALRSPKTARFASPVAVPLVTPSPPLVLPVLESRGRWV